ncbi:ferritin-like domain-containing protein [Caenimonas sedimenti]|uniref:Ferritin-like domain-containing protein n=1 Tax=Caenimonas sedimenti TaxID=2596921 RepID=A0A562ZW76_9BURK|nr:ferritin-like domain-containing protein [Caenimonas sedimenti]TWO72872.1 ferritin-like domain-containing protein [Caenimonas sedimenti]
MEATTTGMNRTGSKMSPLGTKAMVDAANQLSPPQPIDTAGMEAERINYIHAADSVGSIPPPGSVKGTLKMGIAKMKGGQPTILMDKLGERIAFERGGTRLYDALLAKYNALQDDGQDLLPPAEEAMGALAGDAASLAPVQGESPAQTLLRIRNEEMQHFKMLAAEMERMGGDPTAMTPCADVTATSTMGLMQVVTDPRTTLAQCFNAMLTAELTDNAGFELLIMLAEDAGESELAGKLLGAFTQEQEHLAVIKGWLAALVTRAAGTETV